MFRNEHTNGVFSYTILRIAKQSLCYPPDQNDIDLCLVIFHYYSFKIDKFALVQLFS